MNAAKIKKSRQGGRIRGEQSDGLIRLQRRAEQYGTSRTMMMLADDIALKSAL